MALTIGQVVRLTESQTGIEDMPHLIVGENISVAGSRVTIRHTLLPIRPTDVWYLGFAKWGVDTKVGY